MGARLPIVSAEPAAGQGRRRHRRRLPHRHGQPRFAALTLPFVENDLVASSAKLEAISAGRGRSLRALFARATTLQLGDITVQKR
jgi:hypothetical protein